MAGKAAAMHGHVYDAQPFRFNEKQTAADYYGKLLEMGMPLNLCFLHLLCLA